MRFVCAPAMIAITIFIPSEAAGQLSIINYQLVSETPVARTMSNLAYRADIVNTGVPRTSVSAMVVSTVQSVQVIEGDLRFSNVPANGQVTSSDTFTIRVDRTVLFNFANLRWTFSAPADPVANAGADQTARVGSTIALNASLSSNPGGVGTLSYSWAFTSRPAGSTAVLNNPTAVMPTFLIDKPGSYVIALTVSNGLASDTDSVAVSTTNSPPVAQAGPDQTVTVGATVTLNGTASSDVDGNPLTYAWTLTTKPAASTAVLIGASTVSPVFVADKPGIYVAQLVVNDGTLKSAPDSVSITTSNTAPVANAGPTQTVNVGAVVQLTGAGSTDVDGNPLTYQWSLNSVPAGSAAVLSSPTAVNPTFTADRPGTYVAQLIVHDGAVNSAPHTVSITTNALLAPGANAGPNQTVKHGTLVTLSGSGTDPQGLPLTVQWSLTTKPAASTAVLSGPILANPTFTADLPGSYVAQLIVNNGFLNSAPATVTITTTNTAPVANAGANQSVAAGALVTLNGSSSSDADGDPLSYSWSFTSQPAGSTAMLSAASSPSPTFRVDRSGTYIVQLIVGDRFRNSDPATVTIIATDRGLIILPSIESIGLSKSAPFPIVLTTPAPEGGVTVILTSSDDSKTALSATSVFVAQDAVEPATVPHVTAVNLGSATINASANGYTSASRSVQVTATIFFSPSSLAIHGVDTKNLNLTLSAPAPAGGLVLNLTSSNPDVAIVPATVVIPQSTTTVEVPVTSVSPGQVQIHATASYVATTSAGITVIRRDIILPGVIVPPGESVAFPVTLAKPAQKPTFITLAISDESKVALSFVNVFINPGQTHPAAPPRITGLQSGSATITATAIDLNPEQTSVKVGYAADFIEPILTVPAGETRSLLLRLSGRAPQNGLTMALRSSNPDVGAVAPTVVFGALSTIAAVPVTGSAPGSAIITAGAPEIGEATATINVEGLGAIVMTTGTSVAVRSTATLPVSLSTPAPAEGLTVTLASSDNLKVTVSPLQLTFPAGQTQPSVQPSVVGLSPGSAKISASAPGYGSVTRPIEVWLQRNAAVAQATAIGGTPQNALIGKIFTSPLTVLVTDAAGVPVNGASVTFGVPSNGPSASFAGGVNTAITNASGVATSAALMPNALAGSYLVTASVIGGQGTATFSLTNILAASAPQTIGITPVLVGRNLQMPVTLTLPSPAPAGGLRVTIASGDPGLLLVAGRPGDAGTAQLSITIGEGLTTVGGIYVQGLASSGSVPLTATAPGLTGIAIITLNPSGFLLAGPNGIGAPGFTQSVGNSTQLALVAARLDSSFNYAETQLVRGGLSVALQISEAGMANSVSPASLTLNGGTSTMSVTFSALAIGTSTVTAVVPAGFSVPAQATNTLSANIIPGTLLATHWKVGYNLQTSATIRLTSPAPHTGISVTLNSSDPGRVLFSTTPDRAGSASIDLPIQGGRTSTSNFYIQGLGESGSVTYTATAPGFGSASGTVTLHPSGFALFGPFGLGANFYTTNGADESELNVYPALLDSTGNIVEFQQTRGGLPVETEVTSSNPAVGTVTVSPVRFDPGTPYVTTRFHPVSEGTTILAVKAEAFTIPSQHASLTATVKAPGLLVPDGVSIGRNLQAASTVLLGRAAPTGGLLLTLTSNSDLLLLSESAASPGSRSITIVVGAGQTSAPYVMQALAESGTATYTINAPGYSSTTASVTFAPSGVAIAGPSGFGFPLMVSKSGGSQKVTVCTVLLDAQTGFITMAQPLAAGLSLPVSLSNSDPGVGTINSALTISGGSDSAVAEFIPLSAGNAAVSVTTSSDYTIPRSSTTLWVIVTDGGS